MRKNITLVITALLIQLIAFSQGTTGAAKTKWGQPVKSTKRNYFSAILGKDSDNIYAFQKYKSGLYGLGEVKKLEMLSYNKETMSLKLANDIDLEGRSLESVKMIGEQVYVFLTETDNKTDVITLQVQEIDRKTLTLMPKIYTIGKMNFGNASKRKRGFYNIAHSPDNNYILVNYIHSKDDKYAKQKVDIRVFDTDFDLVWEKLDNLPFADEFFSLKEMRVSNDGEVYVLGQVIEEKRDRKNKKQEFQLYAYKNDGEKIVEYPLVIKDKLIVEMVLAIVGNGDIIVGGFYANEDYISGTFYMRINAINQEVAASSFKEFGIDFLVQGLSEKKEKKTKKKAAKGKDVGLYAYDLRNLKINNDGSVVFIAEQSYVVTSTSTDANGNRITTTTFYDNDIIAVYVNPQGEIVENIKISKAQIGSTSFFHSYVLAIKNNELYFIYNDHIKNLNKTNNGVESVFRGPKKAVAVVVKVDDSGKIKKSALFGSKEVGTLMRPKVSVQFENNDDVYVVGQKGKKISLGRITLK